MLELLITFVLAFTDITVPAQKLHASPAITLVKYVLVLLQQIAYSVMHQLIEH